jgi:hypothetical protein
MRRFIRLVSGLAYAVAAVTLLVTIVVLATSERSMQADYGSGPGLALLIVLTG